MGRVACVVLVVNSTQVFEPESDRSGASEEEEEEDDSVALDLQHVVEATRKYVQV